ncbi:hypothetical protein K523DRAFT_416385 [Schizophyllum commune Tattone D]|nr:hypothetical protein K523DRAFT_416385 [Schizophyllum commune Tattone D]
MIPKLIQDSRASLKRLAERANLELQQINFCASPRDLKQVIQSKITRLGTNKSPAAPIDGLPPEILTEVFILAVKSLPYSDQLRMAASIARVTTFWRLVAHAIPHLWTCLSIESARDMHRYYSHHMALAGDLPLRVHCTTSTTTLLFLLEFPSHSLQRFTSMQLATPVNIRHPYSYTHILPHLEELTIDIVYPDFSPAIGNMDRELMYFLAAPRLRSLTINVREYGFYRELHWRHPCTALTSLTIVTDAESEMLDFLPVLTLLPQCSESLERISIDVEVSGPMYLSAQISTMPRLAEICVRRGGCELLRYIIAPNVRAITLADPPESFTGDLAAFSERASRLAGLQRLSIHHMSGDDDDGRTIARCMAKMDNLAEILITDSLVPLVLVRSLTCYEDERPLLPKLRRLEFVNPENENELDLTLREMRASRMGMDIVCRTSTVLP